MLETILKQWEESSEEEVNLELSKDTHYFELRERFHYVHVYFSELNERGGLVLSVDLQKEEDYKKYVKKMFTFDLPRYKLEKYPRFFGLYKLVLDTFANKLWIRWEENGANIDITITLKGSVFDATLVLLYGPNRLYYHVDTNTNSITDELKKFMMDVVGFYTIFKEYGEKLKFQEKPQEKT